MYKCERCKAVFEDPEEIHTSYEIEYGIASDFSSHTPLTLHTCPYCGSERIKEYEEELENE